MLIAFGAKKIFLVNPEYRNKVFVIDLVSLGGPTDNRVFALSKMIIQPNRAWSTVNLSIAIHNFTNE